MSAQFAEIATEVFQFLEGLGFYIACAEPHYLRYESRDAVVILTLDVLSGELEAYVGLRSEAGKPGGSYSLTDVNGMQGLDGYAGPLQISDDSQLKHFVELLAIDLRDHAMLALQGDLSFFRQLESYVNSKSEMFTKGLQTSRIRSNAEQAWRKRDYVTVAKLYALIGDCLSDVERKKLEYARHYIRD